MNINPLLPLTALLAFACAACTTRVEQPAEAAPAPVATVDVEPVAPVEPAEEAAEMRTVVEDPHTVEPEGELPSAPEEPAYDREDVLWIQQRLIQLGYMDGPADGAVGEQTRAAVRAYQRDQDIEADGKPTSTLREFMWRNGG